MNPLQNVPPDKGQSWFIDVVPHSHALGLCYVESGIGRLVLDLPWRAELVGDPEAGLMHGGVITTLIDAACGGAVLSRLSDLCRVATLDLRIDYLRPARTRRTVRCRAECHRLTRHIAFTRALAHDGDVDDPLASAVGTFVVFGDDAKSHQRAGDPNAWVIPQ